MAKVLIIFLFKKRAVLNQKRQNTHDMITEIFHMN